MKFQWYEELPKVWQEIVDQALHFAFGFVIGLFNPLFSISACLGREWFQNCGDTNNDAINMLTDITFWTLGAVVASLVF